MAAREPVFNLSESFVVTISGVLAAVWLASLFLPAGLIYEIDRVSVLQPLAATSGSEFVALLGYSLRHVGLGHLFLNIVGIMWFGTLTLRGARARRVREASSPAPVMVFLTIFAAAAILGGMAQWAWWAATGTTSQEMVGASGAVSGLLATGLYALSGRVVMLRFGVVWAMINILLVAMPELSGGNAGWPAHLGGYLAGVGLAGRYVLPRATG